MSKKKAFALRIDEDLLNAVEKWANDEFRSTNGQIEWIIRQALLQTGRIHKENKDRPTNDTESLRTEPN
ncbi:MAG: Arc family DNA-binding protein [Microscillaceae bacterium]|nr:Arc family DNA-binding protein [Microscillaceae bacterium]MDW8459685.1 Arc family DNA-binding protein [Cytophagales bacterium]